MPVTSAGSLGSLGIQGSGCTVRICEFRGFHGRDIVKPGGGTERDKVHIDELGDCRGPIPREAIETLFSGVPRGCGGYYYGDAMTTE